jgi:undecaprenyl diphosphate synthase
MTTIPQQLPRHLGIILDGNRRWAKDKGLSTLEGHQAGSDTLKNITQAAFERGIAYVSAYAFSTENWSRNQEEVSYLMNLTFKFATKEVHQLMENNVRVVVLGSEDKIQAKLLKSLKKLEAESKNNTGGTLALCFNYGGYQEITDAVKKVVKSGKKADQITEEDIAANLYHPEVPPIDFMIRTSGEMRLSNFMLWRMAYAELYFTDKHWPDFDTIELDKALAEYAKRNRRFGGN